MAKVTIHLDLDAPDDQLLLNFISKKSEISCFLFELMTSNFRKKIENIEESLLYYPESKYKDWDKEKKLGLSTGIDLVLDQLHLLIEDIGIKLEDITY
jgi:hypothetical protein